MTGVMRWRFALEHSVMGRRLARAACRAYGDDQATATSHVMSSSKHRYRITVTPIEADGLQCSGRCTIEFEQRSPRNWMHELEDAQRQRRLSCNEAAGAVVATGLLEALAVAARDDAHPLAALQPELDVLIAKLQALRQAR